MLNKTEYIVDSSRSRYDKLRPFTSRPIVPPYFLTLLSTAIIKAWIGLGYVFPVAFGFSFHDPRAKHPLERFGQKRPQTSKIYITEKYAKYGLRSNRHTGRALPC